MLRIIGRRNIGDIRHAIGKTIAGGDPYAQELLKHGLLRGGKGSKAYILTPEGRAIAEILIAKEPAIGREQSPREPRLYSVEPT